ncbi:MAG: hypothetical protein AAF317_18300, partial [Pseudomonadota bacterium]
GGPGSAEERARRITPWFARAMLDDGEGAAETCSGLAVGFSYASYGGVAEPFLPGFGTRLRDRLGLVAPWECPSRPFEDAYTDAGTAGCGLAAVLTQLRARLDFAGYSNRPIDIVCHSLGARTTLTALSMLAQRSSEDDTLSRIERVIMLSGACYWGQAADALANIRFAAPLKQPQFFNFTSRSDDVLRHFRRRRTASGPRRASTEMLGLDPMEARLIRDGRIIGWDGCPDYTLYSAFGEIYSDWIDIPLDASQTKRWGQRNGLDLRGGPGHPFGDHWTSFTHPGNWALYRNILHDREAWSVALLRRRMER